MKYPNQSNLEEKQFILIYNSGHSHAYRAIIVPEAWSSRSDHIYNEEQREINVCVITFLLACAQFDVSVLKQFRNACLGNGAPHSGLCLPT